MKRTIQLDVEDEGKKRLKASQAPVDDILNLLKNSDLSTAALVKIMEQAKELYSTQTNSVVQNFPTDLWGKILKLHGKELRDPFSLLSWRLVCKSWVFAVSKIKTLHIGTTGGQFDHFFGLLSLQSLKIDESNEVLDWSRLCQLKKLTLFGAMNSFPPNNGAWKSLSLLTQLTVLKIDQAVCPAKSLLALVNLKRLVLTSFGGYDRYRDETAPWDFLTKLKSLDFLEITQCGRRYRYTQDSCIPKLFLTQLKEFRSDDTTLFADCNGTLVSHRYEHEGQWLNGRANGPGIRRFQNGRIQQGIWSDGVMVGKGTEISVDGTYEGCWVEDYKHGQGKHKEYDPERCWDGEWEFDRFVEGTLTDKNYVEKGRFRDWKLDGRGTRQDANGCWYEGDWLEGSRDGFGHLISETGDAYKGDWRENVPWGEGTWTSCHHDRVYSGGFTKGIRDGRGILKWRFGAMMDGHWDGRMIGGSYTRPPGAEDALQCSGQLLTPDGVYEGEYLQINPETQYPHGKGVMKYSDGALYGGDWFDGVPHGEGSMTDRSGTYTGGWEYGDPTGQGVAVRAADGARSEGRFINLKLSGHGKQNGGDGPRFMQEYVKEDANLLFCEGQWKHGLMHGQGSCVYDDGTSFSGIFYEDRAEDSHGGTLFFPDGRVFIGAFDEGNAQHGTLVSPDGSKSIYGFWSLGKFIDSRSQIGRRMQLERYDPRSPLSRYDSPDYPGACIGAYGFIDFATGTQQYPTPTLPDPVVPSTPGDGDVATPSTPGVGDMTTPGHSTPYPPADSVWEPTTIPPTPSPSQRD